MHVIEVRNVNQALPRMVHHLLRNGLTNESRAGEVKVAPTPVTTVYHYPAERVLFSGYRDANPFFHLIEALWMLWGSNSLPILTHYNRRMAEFSDDGGETQHGAYGFRWRYHFGRDQLEDAIRLLQNKPHSRRAVIQMWDCNVDIDLLEKLKDVPCNLVVTPWLDTTFNTLNITVFCRSNDAIWGAAGANAVHFSILQEYLAARLNAKVGKYYQVSNNFHAYSDILEKFSNTDIAAAGYQHDPYSASDTLVTKLVDDPATFDRELYRFFAIHSDWLEVDKGRYKSDESHGFFMRSFNTSWSNSIFPNVVIPMTEAYMIFRRRKDEADRFPRIAEILQKMKPENGDWTVAAKQWMIRRCISSKD